MFFPELNLIDNQSLRASVKYLLTDLDKSGNLSNMPASTSGKYHPEDERGPGGFLRHLRKMVKVSHDLAHHLGFSGSRHDSIIVAAALHDCAKPGFTHIDGDHWIKDDYLYKQHEALSAVIVENAFRTKLDDNRLSEITDAIRCHSGAWDKDKPLPSTVFETALSTCDYLTTRTYIMVDLEEAPQ